MNQPNPFVWLVLLGVWLASSVEAAAYIDPGSSSYLFQILIGGLTAIAFFFGSIRRRVAAGWQRVFRRSNAVPPPASEPVEPRPSRDA